MSNSDCSLKWQLFMEDARKRGHTGCTLEVRGTQSRLTGLVLGDKDIQLQVGSQCLEER